MITQPAGHSDAGPAGAQWQRTTRAGLVDTAPGSVESRGRIDSGIYFLRNI